MARNYKIDWKKGDLIRLGQAVSNFNKRINELAQEVKDPFFLPVPQNYSELKETIYTRKELERTINSLKQINKADALEQVNGITKWEQRQFDKNARQYVKNYQELLKEYQQPNEQGYTGEQMGNTKAEAYKKRIEKVKNYNKLTEEQQANLRQTVLKSGTTDFLFKLQINYKRNFINTIKDNFIQKEYAEELIKALNKINVNDFYDKTKSLNVVDWLQSSYYRIDPSQYYNLLEEFGIINEKTKERLLKEEES